MQCVNEICPGKLEIPPEWNSTRSEEAAGRHLAGTPDQISQKEVDYFKAEHARITADGKAWKKRFLEACDILVALVAFSTQSCQTENISTQSEFATRRPPGNWDCAEESETVNARVETVNARVENTTRSRRKGRKNGRSTAESSPVVEMCDYIEPIKHDKLKCDSISDLSTDFGDSSESLSSGEELVSPTTVMLRNLPNNYSRQMLLSLIDAEGFAGQYDFLYLPIDFSSKASFGYAFLNLTSHAQASWFVETFHGFSRWSIPSRKACVLGWSRPHQGCAANIERYRNSPIMHDTVPDDYKPVVFSKGKRVPFPPSTKRITRPRPRALCHKSASAT